MLNIHYEANYHVHGRDHSDDAGKPSAMKGACQGLEGDGWNRSKQLAPRQPSTLLFQNVEAGGSLLEAGPNGSRGRRHHPQVYRGSLPDQTLTLKLRLFAAYRI